MAEKSYHSAILSTTNPTWTELGPNPFLHSKKPATTTILLPTIIETMRLNRLCWFGHVQGMEGNRIDKRVLYMNLGTTRLRGRPRNRQKDQVREDGRIVCGERWQEKVRNRGMEEAPENGKESSHSACANGTNERSGQQLTAITHPIPHSYF